jgi:membrane-associated phospholipid phosphatase
MPVISLFETRPTFAGLGRQRRLLPWVSLIATCVLAPYLSLGQMPARNEQFQSFFATSQPISYSQNAFPRLPLPKVNLPFEKERAFYLRTKSRYPAGWERKRFFSSVSREESPYRIRLKSEVPLLGAEGVLLGVSMRIGSSLTPLTLQEVNNLDHTNVWALDREAAHQYSVAAGKVSDALLYTSMAMPLLYLTREKTRRDFGKIALMQVETGLLAYGLVCLTKGITQRIRPFAYNPAAPMDDKLTINAKASFYSGHAAASAAMSFFMASTFSRYYPESRLKPWVWTYAAVWPAAVGYLRYRAGSHYPSDILTGYLVGAASGILIPRIHEKLWHRRKKPKLVY